MLRCRRAFSFVEMLIALVTMALLGGVAVTALWFFAGMASQTDDYTAGRLEIESAFQAIGRQITNASLAMPNNRSGRGTFSASFRAPFGAHPPLAWWGEPDWPEIWGGPVMLGTRNDNANGKPDSPIDVRVKTTNNIDGEDVYIGPELYFAWAVPTGLRVDDGRTGQVESNATITFQMLQPGGVSDLIAFRYDGRNIGVLQNAADNLRSWILFPTLRIPMLVTALNGGANTITVNVAPGTLTRPADPFEQRAYLGGFEEVCLPQACRIFVRDGELRQQFYDSTSDSSTEAVLARNIAAVFFKFNPASRLVTMYIAARGADPLPAGKSDPAIPERWPAFAAGEISVADQRARLLVETMTWRIRN